MLIIVDLSIEFEIKQVFDDINLCLSLFLIISKFIFSKCSVRTP